MFEYQEDGLVTVRYLSDKSYTYRSGDLDLRKGQLVLVPRTVMGGPVLAIVDELRSDYLGPTHRILEKASVKKDLGWDWQ